MYLLDLRPNYQNKNVDEGFAFTLPRVPKLHILLLCISLLTSGTEALFCISHLMLAIEKGVPAHLLFFSAMYLEYCDSFRKNLPLET